MKISELVLSLLIFSALSIGFANFFLGTASNYTSESENLKEFSSELSRTSYIDSQMKAIQQKLNEFDPTNPLTWGNFVSTIINVFAIIFSLPGEFHSIIVYMTQNILFIPGWTAGIVEIIILVIVIFAAISAVNKDKV